MCVSPPSLPPRALKVLAPGILVALLLGPTARAEQSPKASVTAQAPAGTGASPKVETHKVQARPANDGGSSPAKGPATATPRSETSAPGESASRPPADPAAATPAADASIERQGHAHPDGRSLGSAGPWRAWGGVEAGVQPLAISPAQADVFALFTPVLALAHDQGFLLELGAPLRLSMGALVGSSPARLRAEDWDELSDFGQLLRGLRLGRETDSWSLWAGPLTLETLGHGALVGRYGNRALATHAPAGARLRVETGAVRTEVLAGDVLALRLLAAEVRVDGGHLLTGRPGAGGHWHVALGAAHDAGRVAAASPAVTLAHVDADALFWRSGSLQIAGFGGVGARLGRGSGNVGGQVGLEFEAQLSAVVFGARLSGRRVSGGYRPGFFGPAYELERLSEQGFTRAPLAEVRLPAGYSGHALLQLGLGGQSEEELRDPRTPRASVSLAVEHFDWGRTDADAAVQWELPERGLSVAARGGVTGLGEVPRTWLGLEGRGRLGPSVYLLGSAGTTFAPRAGGGLTRGWTASLGAGFDFELGTR